MRHQVRDPPAEAGGLQGALRGPTLTSLSDQPQRALTSAGGHATPLACARLDRAEGGVDTAPRGDTPMQLPSDMRAFNEILIAEFRANGGKLSGRMANSS